MPTTTERTIFEPVEKRELIRGWLLHSHKSRDRHDVAARWYDLCRYWIGIPAAVLSAAVGTAVFASLTRSYQNDDLFVPILVAVLAVGAAVLTSLHSFLDLGSLAERHRLAAVRYKAIIREMEQMGLDSGHEPHLEISLIDDLRNRFDALEEETPVVGRRIHRTIERRFSKSVKSKTAKIEKAEHDTSERSLVS